MVVGALSSASTIVFGIRRSDPLTAVVVFTTPMPLTGLAGSGAVESALSSSGGGKSVSISPDRRWLFRTVPCTARLGAATPGAATAVLGVAIATPVAAAWEEAPRHRPPTRSRHRLCLYQAAPLPLAPVCR